MDESTCAGLILTQRPNVGRGTWFINMTLLQHLIYNACPSNNITYGLQKAANESNVSGRNRRAIVERAAQLGLFVTNKMARVSTEGSGEL